MLLPVRLSSLSFPPEKLLGWLGPTSTEAVNFYEDSEEKKNQPKNSPVLGGELENEAVAVVFIVCTLIRESKNNNACNADFGLFPCSFSQARQPWEPLIVWHTRGTASITKHRAGQPFLRIKYVRDDKNLPSMGSGNNKKKYTRGWSWVQHPLQSVPAGNTQIWKVDCYFSFPPPFCACLFVCLFSLLSLDAPLPLSAPLWSQDERIAVAAGTEHTQGDWLKCALV